MDLLWPAFISQGEGQSPLLNGKLFPSPRLASALGSRRVKPFLLEQKGPKFKAVFILGKRLWGF
jgi:hypothetical protein